MSIQRPNSIGVNSQNAMKATKLLLQSSKCYVTIEIYECVTHVISVRPCFWIDVVEGGRNDPQGSGGTTI